MIDNIPGNELFNNEKIGDFTNFVLFEGRNGSGKSTLLNLIRDDFYKKNPQYRYNDLFLDYRLELFRTRHNAQAEIPPRDWRNFDSLMTNTKGANRIKEILDDIFERNLELNKVKSTMSPTLEYLKNEQELIPFDKDGAGIYNAFNLLRFVTNTSVGVPLFIEEISSGLYPRLLPKLLDAFFKIAEEYDHQIFATTQDPFVVYYFLKNKMEEKDDRINWNDENPDYSVFNFTDKEFLRAEKVSGKNYDKSLNTLMPREFMGGVNYMKFSSLFS